MRSPIVSGKIAGKTETLTTHVQERYEAFDLVGAYTASIVLAAWRCSSCSAMQLYQSGRLRVAQAMTNSHSLMPTDPAPGRLS